MAYALGAVEPFVRDVAEQVGPMFGVSSIGGWRANATDMTGHPAGLALDFMVSSDINKGNRVATYFVSNAAKLRVKYVIWRQRIWRPGAGWKKMEYRSGDRPGYDPNHMRHVHVSFTKAAAKGDGAGTVPTDKDESGRGELWPWLIPGLGPLEYLTDGGVSDAVGGVAGDVADAITTPAQALATIMSGDTWKRVALVIGGAGAIVTGIVILVASSKEAQGAILAAVPHPAAKVAGAAVATSEG